MEINLILLLFYWAISTAIIFTVILEKITINICYEQHFYFKFFVSLIVSMFLGWLLLPISFIIFIIEVVKEIKKCKIR